MAVNETAEEPALEPESRATPGLLLVWSGAEPAWIARPLLRPLKVGRSEDADVCLGNDTRVSRLHAEVRAAGDGFVVRDRGSTHGTFVDGERIEGTVTVAGGALLRVGRTLMILGPLPEGSTEIEGGYVVSPYQRTLRMQVRAAARLGVGILILGPTGSGKEALARVYHEASAHARGPFVSHSGPNLQATTAEAELFGSRRGAFTGAVDRDGLLAQADGGTLFLDEIGDLPLEIQSKLLRALQEREIAPVGGIGRPRRVDFLLCAATSLDLEAAVAQGEFRRDFLERIRGATIRVRPLDERRDEIPFLLATHPKLAASGHTLSAFFVEACMRRSWPGNVRGLWNALTDALVSASAKSDARVELMPHHLDGHNAPPPKLSPEDAERALLIDALRRTNGNGVEAAKLVGIAKTTFYDKLAKHGIKLR